MKTLAPGFACGWSGRQPGPLPGLLFESAQAQNTMLEDPRPCLDWLLGVRKASGVASSTCFCKQTDDQTCWLCCGSGRRQTRTPGTRSVELALTGVRRFLGPGFAPWRSGRQLLRQNWAAGWCPGPARTQLRPKRIYENFGPRVCLWAVWPTARRQTWTPAWAPLRISSGPKHYA